jgi:hypothetical protein
MQWPAVQTVERFSAAITVAEQTESPYFRCDGIHVWKNSFPILFAGAAE